MKDYLLVFTENVDKYNMDKQLQFYSESDIYKYNLSEDYDKIIECAEEAKYLGYDSFHFITLNEDWAEMDYELKRELKGFKEVGVIKANYGIRRFREADSQPQTKKIATVFPYSLLPLDQSGKIQELYLRTLEKKYPNAKVEATFYKRNVNDKTKLTPEQYYKVAQAQLKDIPSFNQFFKAPTQQFEIDDYNQLLNFTQQYEIISPQAINGGKNSITGQAPANSIVSAKAAAEFYLNLEKEYEEKRGENLSGKAPNNFQQEIQDWTKGDTARSVIVNYIQNNITNVLINIEHLEINQYNINGDINILGDATKQILDWEGNKELNSDTPFALAQNLAGAAAGMITNYNGVNDKSREDAAKVTQAISQQTGLGKGVAEYFSKQKDAHNEKISTNKAKLGAKLAWDRDEKEFQTKFAEIDRKIEELKSKDSSKDDEDIQMEILKWEKAKANLKKDYEERSTKKDSLQQDYITQHGGVNGESKTKDIDKYTQAEGQRSKQNIKDMQSETRRVNLIKKFMNDENLINSLKQNLQTLDITSN